MLKLGKIELSSSQSASAFWTSVPRLVLVLAVASGCMLAFPAQGWAQQKKDPTAETKMIQQTMAKIRDVEKLDTFIEANKELQKQNVALQKSIKELNAKVNKLTVQLKQQQESLRKQLLQMPKFHVQAKVISRNVNMAILKSDKETILIRAGTTMSVPVNGVWVLMEVRKITKDRIELYFPDLKRPLFLND